MIFLMPFLLGCHLWFPPHGTQTRIELLQTAAAVIELDSGRK